VTYTLTVNDYAGTTQTVTVGASGSTKVTWPVDSNGYYDVIITANTSDGFTRRYAGRIALPQDPPATVPPGTTGR
jgi:phospholipase C